MILSLYAALEAPLFHGSARVYGFLGNRAVHAFRRVSTNCRVYSKAIHGDCVEDKTLTTI
jgi:hypothetical protein